MTLGFYLAVPLMAILAILQATILPNFPMFGIIPQLWLLATLSWAMLNGIREGLLWALIAGIFVDLFSAAPMGTTSLALMAAVAAVVFVQRHFPPSRILMPALLGALGTLVYWFIYLFLLRIIIPLIINNHGYLGIASLSDNVRAPDLLGEISAGYSLGGPILTYIVISAVVQGFLILPVFWGFQALKKALSARRVEV
jgi:rod shape-determining protein MreD